MMRFLFVLLLLILNLIAPCSISCEKNPHYQGMVMEGHDPHEAVSRLFKNPYIWRPNPPPTSKSSSGSQMSAGCGIFDITGSVAEIGFMGYAQPSQKGAGLLFRTRSRAFVFVDDNNNRAVYVSIDLCMGFEIVRQGVIDLLQKKYGSTMYTHDNVIISGTHSHATPGGIGGTGLVDLTTLGFVAQNYDAAVQGIFQSIVIAHHNVAPAKITLNWGDVQNGNINRSPSAYELNTDKGEYNSNTDKEMTVLRIDALNGTAMGMIAFYSVHGTSLNNTNMFVSGDNKGWASLKTEKLMNPGYLPGTGPFVAAYGQTNEGDSSPNTMGPSCPDGTPCVYNHSTCNGRCQGCIARGPGANMDMYDSMRIIGDIQMNAALSLYNNAVAELNYTEGVAYRHQYFNMETINVSAEYTGTGQPGITCLAALGYSFAAGTTDGPGDFNFVQGATNTSWPWSVIVNWLTPPSKEEVSCHYPKPILLNTGVTKPYQFSSYILPEQIVKIGNLYIMAVPGEFTTMSGRRLRGLLQKRLQQAGRWYEDSHIVIAGLANSFSHYIATYEEYQQQRYEAASTLYGPHTLAAHMQNFDTLIDSLLYGTQLNSTIKPIDMRNHTFSFMPPVIVDVLPSNVTEWGQVHIDVDQTQPYYPGQWVNVSFWGGNPRNNLMRGSSFLYVDISTDSYWNTIAIDGSDDTVFSWQRVGLASSLCGVHWHIPADVVSGVYRLRHWGFRKLLSGDIQPYGGISSTFKVINNTPKEE